jgi:hypothetical protein
MLCGKKLILSGVLGPYDEDKHIELVHQQFVWRKGTLHRIYMAPEVKGFDRVYYYSPSVGPRKKITGFQEVFPERVDALMDLGATQAEAEAFRLFYMESAKEVVWRLFHGKIAPRALIRGDWHKPASLVSSCGPYLVGLVANDMGETEKPPTPAEYRKMLARMAREEAREHDHVPRSEVQEPEDPHDFLMSLSADEEI